MPERSTRQEDVEELMRSSYEGSGRSRDELGKEVRQLADGTPVRLSEQGREWQGKYVPDVALTIVRSEKEEGILVYVIQDEDGSEFRVRDTDVEVDVRRSTGRHAA